MRNLMSSCVAVVMMLMLATSASSQVQAPKRLRCEMRSDPVGLEELRPALSWELVDKRRGATQTAYEVRVASSPEKLDADGADLWHSGRVDSDRSHLVIYEGKLLTSRQRVWWSVRYWDQDGQVSDWSQPAMWEMGLLAPEDWSAQWISVKTLEPQAGKASDAWMQQAMIPDGLEGEKLDPRVVEQFEKMAHDRLADVTPAFQLRKEFELRDEIAHARLYLSTLGYHEVTLNGERIDADRLEPGVAHYRAEALYVVKDPASLLRQGRNCIGVVVSNGRYNEEPAPFGDGYYGKQAAMLAQLEITYRDGHREVITTDETWRGKASPIVKDSFWIGEAYDARLEQDGWDRPGADEQGWAPVTVVNDALPRRLRAQSAPPEREIKRVRPVDVSNPAPGVWVFDMGELIIGNAELKVDAPEGTVLTMRYAEDIRDKYPGYYYRTVKSPYYEDASFADRPGMLAPKGRGVLVHQRMAFEKKGYRGVLAVPTDVYIAKGGREEKFQRRFGYRPFRYVEVQGLTQEPTADTVTGVLVRTALTDAGGFTSSNDTLNLIEKAGFHTIAACLHNIQHDNNGAEKGYFIHQTALNFATFAFRSDFAPMVSKMLEDVRVFTETEDRVASIVFGKRQMSPYTGDTHLSEQQHYTELPWQVYQFYGDRRELEKHYAVIQRYIRYWYQNPMFKDLIRTDNWADHMAYTSAFDQPDRWLKLYQVAKGDNRHPTPQEFYCTAVGHRFVSTAADIAKTLGKSEDEAAYRQIAEDIRAFVNDRFYDPARKTYCPDAPSVQGANALAIDVGIAQPSDVQPLLDSILHDMKDNWNGHLSTGSRASYPLLSVFSRHGRVDEAYKIMSSTSYPSLGHMLSFGTGMIGECWEYPDAPPMASHAQTEGFSAMVRWNYEWLCGIRPDPQQPGFKHFFVEPKMPSGLDSASMWFISSYGRISSGWQRQGDTITVTVEVPANTSCTVTLPTSDANKVAEGGRPVNDRDEMQVFAGNDHVTQVRMGSGVYSFVISP